ncbi:putative Hsp70 protein [Trypanosoma vivax]|nr:putative Hsp70 protein [Trypanosoma vivax]
MILVSLCAFLTLLRGAVVSADVLGIDLGSDFLEVAGPVNGMNVDIVLNEQSHRKTDNYIGFRNGERFVGAQAKSLAARFPVNMVAMVNHLVGVKFNSSDFEAFEKLELEFEPHPGERGVVGFSFGGQDGSYTVEEVYAMLLHYCRSISIKGGVPNPKNLVITIPYHSSLAVRQAILESARLVNMSTFGLMHSTTATALYYGIRRRGFGNKTVHLLVYDMGSTHTEVGVYKFSPPEERPDKKVKNLDSFGTLATLAIASDRFLGGRAFDLCIAKVIEAEAVSKMNITNVMGGRTTSQRKARFSLLRAAKKTREVLSANSKTPVTVEGIAPERDFSTEFTRSDFEEKCADLFQRVPKVAERALSISGLSLKDIDAFEMMGGASRTPKILRDLSQFWGKDVYRTLNSDESAAMGAAFYALRFSSHYRSRSFRIVERAPFAFSFTVSPSSSNPIGAMRMLAENPVIGSRRSITLNRTSDFTINLFDLSGHVGDIVVTNVNQSLDKLGFFKPDLQHPNNSHIVRIQLYFNESGLMDVEEADVVYRYAANVSSIVKANVTSNETNTSYKVEYAVKMKIRTAPLQASIIFTDPAPLSAEEFRKSRDKISQLLEKERRKHEAATAKNNLEAYLYWAKTEGALENETALSYFTSEEVNELRNTLAAVQEWLEDGEGSYDSCGAEEYEKKLQEIKTIVVKQYKRDLSNGGDNRTSESVVTDNNTTNEASDAGESAGNETAILENSSSSDQKSVPHSRDDASKGDL